MFTYPGRSTRQSLYGEYDIDWKNLERALRLAARIGCRQTNVTMSLPHWDAVQKEDRLVGVSLTGFMDLCNLVGMHPLSETASRFLERCRAIVNNEVDYYSFIMRIPRPRLACTVKPEGSQSKMPGCSSGAGEWPYADSEYVFQRIRISDSDLLTRVMEMTGHLVEKDVTDPNTDVVRFPVRRTPQSYKLSAIEQLELYFRFQEHYTDHNTSYTVHVKDHEWDGLIAKVDRDWDRMISCSFFADFDTGVNSPYPQLPYERITKGQYDEAVAAIRPFDYSLLQQIEVYDSATDITEGDCINGACPVR
jgi:hypothetical protein